MKSSVFGGLAAFVFTATGVAASSYSSITIKGNAFFQGSNRFLIKGVDFQPGGSSSLADPLADGNLCKEVIPYFTKLGANTIRVYAVDNSANHDDCMNQLAAAGIGLILDVNTGEVAINRANPGPSYNAVLLQHVFATIDAFKGYPNTMAFFAANEVINDANTTSSAPYIKAVVRDMKQYINAQSSRYIPVGYSAADVASNRMQTAEYLNCGDDSARVDFFAFNDYSWCGDSSYTQSGYDQKVKNFTDYGIPLFFSEYGCNLVKPRQFTEVQAIYSSAMTAVFSGGLVYEFTQEANDYGLVTLDNSTGKVTTLSDFNALESQFSKVSTPSGSDGANTSAGKASTCPAQSSDWAVTNDNLPAIPSGAQQYIKSGAGTPLGNNGPSNMWGGASASAPAAAGTPSSTHKSDASVGRPASLNMVAVGIASWIVIAGAVGGLFVL